MVQRTRSRLKLAVAAGAFVSTAVIVVGAPPAGVVHAAEITQLPEILYMAPAFADFATTPLPYPVVAVPIGVMPFDGSPDPITGDLRTIEVDHLDNNCDHSARPPTYSGCTVINLSVGNGTLWIPNTLDSQDPNVAIAVAPSGADIDTNAANDSDPGSQMYVRGSMAEVNGALATLVYTPEPGYYYDGADPESMSLLLTGDANTGSVSATIPIMVLDVNDWPELTVPSGTQTVASGGTLQLLDEYDVTDEDNDESTDTGADMDLPCWPTDPNYPTGPCTLDRGDGPDDDMLLFMFATCGGFEFLSTNGFTIEDDLEALIADYVASTPASPTTEEQLVIDAIIAGLEAVSPGITTMPTATNATNAPVAAFAGYAELDDVNYTLGDVTFHAVDPGSMTPIADQTCEVLTIVSDLGNNGLPVLLVLDPTTNPDDQIEIPWLGVDVDAVTFQIGAGTTIEASLPTTPIDVPEGDPVSIPVGIVTDPAVPADHPAFDLSVTATPGGGATAGTDYAAVTMTVNVPEDATSVDIPFSSLDDAFVDPGEFVTISIAPPLSPPPGFVIETPISNVQVNIIDDEVPAAIMASIDDVALAEGDAGTTAFEFTVSLTGPALGGEQVTWATADDSATTADTDYVADTDTITFGLGETSATVTIDVNGDTDGEPDEMFFVGLSAPVGLGIADGQGVGTIENDDVPVDVTSPSVTVEEGSAQADPTGVSPVVFDVLFSEPVTGFVGGDVSLSGTAGASVAVVTGGPELFSVAVSGMTQNGTVIVDVAAGVAEDAALNPNLASTSFDNEVTFEMPAGPDPLVLNVPADITVDNDLGMAGAAVTFAAVTSTGGVPPVAINCDYASGDFFVLGATTVTCTAADSALQQATTVASFKVTVVDAEPPSIGPVADIVEDTTGNAPVDVTFAYPSATDNSGVVPTVTCSQLSTASYLVGVTTVTCTATDGAGNQASTSFTVTVNNMSDTTIPSSTTTDPGTPGSTTTDPGTPGSTTTDPGTPGSTTTDPGTPGSTTTDPGTSGSSTTDPGTPGSTTTDPGATGPTTPSSAAPTSGPNLVSQLPVTGGDPGGIAALAAAAIVLGLVLLGRSRRQPARHDPRS